MSGFLYLSYLLLLLCVPLIVRWRWGLMASLFATLVELGLVALVMYIFATHDRFPDPYAGQPYPDAPNEQLQRHYAVSSWLIWVCAIIPGFAALLGGAASATWASFLALWRFSAQRRVRSPH